MDGILIGLVVGGTDGIVDRWEVGLIVGLRVGGTVGAAKGMTVGQQVGLIVGFVEGVSVGNIEDGLIEGTALVVGLADGKAR